MKILCAIIFFSSFSTLLAASDLPALKCGGTEPFWGVKTQINGDMTFADPATMEVIPYSNTELINADGTSGDFAFQIKGVDADNKSLKLNIFKSACNDGMSDTVFDYTAMVDLEDGILFGCCNKAD